MGLLILEGYGLTETSAGSTVNRPDAYKLGTVGFPFPGCEVKIAADGEVLIKGPNIMRGYHHLDDETAAALSPDGWFASGDIGEIDAQGFLRITDRKKDLIKTSGGKYIAPSHMEGQFKALCPYVSQVIVIGQARNYVTMLLTIDPDVARTLENAVREGTRDPSLVQQFAEQGVAVEFTSSADLDKVIADESAMWAQVIKANNVPKTDLKA